MMIGPRRWTEGFDAVNGIDPAVLGSQERSISMYGCQVKFTARPGQHDVLVDHLLRAATHAETTAGCQLYLINASTTEPESVWVTEVWTTDTARGLKPQGCSGYVSARVMVATPAR